MESESQQPTSAVSTAPTPTDSRGKLPYLLGGILVALVAIGIGYYLLNTQSSTTNQKGTMANPYNPSQGYSGSGYYNISGQAIYISSQSQLKNASDKQTTAATSLQTTIQTSSASTTPTTTGRSSPTTSIAPSPNSSSSKTAQYVLINVTGMNVKLINKQTNVVSNIYRQSSFSETVIPNTTYQIPVVIPRGDNPVSGYVNLPFTPGTTLFSQAGYILHPNTNYIDILYINPKYAYKGPMNVTVYYTTASNASTTNPTTIPPTTTVHSETASIPKSALQYMYPNSTLPRITIFNGTAPTYEIGGYTYDYDMVVVGNQYSNAETAQIFEQNPALANQFGPGSVMVQSFNANTILVAGYTSNETLEAGNMFIREINASSHGPEQPILFDGVIILNATGIPSVIAIVVGSNATSQDWQTAVNIASAIHNVSISGNVGKS